MLNIEDYKEEIEGMFKEYKNELGSNIPEALGQAILDVAMDYSKLNRGDRILEWIYADTARLMTPEEAKYLYDVIKPFDYKVESITRRNDCIEIHVSHSLNKEICLPIKRDEYKRMEENKSYPIGDIKELKEENVRMRIPNK